MPTKTKVIGDPTPMSPIMAEKSPDYEIMTDYSPGIYYPSGAEVIVKHKKSKTFWRAVYAVREDDSDADFGATWTQVKPKRVTITEYERV
jgi:hypothetical protein